MVIGSASGNYDVTRKTLVICEMFSRRTPYDFIIATKTRSPNLLATSDENPDTPPKRDDTGRAKAYWPRESDKRPSYASYHTQKNEHSPNQPDCNFDGPHLIHVTYKTNAPPPCAVMDSGACAFIKGKTASYIKMESLNIKSLSDSSPRLLTHCFGNQPNCQGILFVLKMTVILYQN